MSFRLTTLVSKSPDRIRYLWPVVCLACAISSANSEQLNQRTEVPSQAVAAPFAKENPPNEAIRASKSTLEVGQIAKNFALLGIDEKLYELNRISGKALVVFFTGVGCPVARESLSKLRELKQQYESKGITFWIVDSIFGETKDQIAKEMQEFNAGGIPVLIDESQGVARMFGANRTATTAILDIKSRKLLYRGSIDDQLSEGAKKPEATTKYLQLALDQIISNQQIGTAETPARGCLINFESVNPPGQTISYSSQVAPIIEKKCATCHSPGNIGPFSFASYQIARTMSPMMEEVLLSRRMPPWHADPRYGKFRDNLSLSAEEKRTLLEWIGQGSPGSQEPDPLLTQKQIPNPTTWPYGEPDLIVSVSEPQVIKSTGILDYRYFKTPLPFDRDVWVGALAYRIGNPKVVHHSVLFVEPKEHLGNSAMPQNVIGGWAPGDRPQPYLKDAGFLIPKGSVFNLSLHYNPIGKEEIDNTQVGIYFLKEAPRIQLKYYETSDYEIDIPPHQTGIRGFDTMIIPHDFILYSVVPHMHLRGSSFRVDAITPDGKKEILLYEPRYDFNWQRTYYYEQPRTFPAGTVIISSGTFDNTAQNPNNPDPSARVRFGLQSTDEMLQVFLITGEVNKSTPKNKAKVAIK